MLFWNYSAVSLLGGSGKHANVVYPYIDGQTCNQVCNNTIYKNCDGQMSIHGRMGQVIDTSKHVGVYYNHGCNRVLSSLNDETKRKNENIIAGLSHHVSYCCCRHWFEMNNLNIWFRQHVYLNLCTLCYLYDFLRPITNSSRSIALLYSV